MESFDIITVKAQQYGLAFVQGQPLILEPGWLAQGTGDGAALAVDSQLQVYTS